MFVHAFVAPVRTRPKPPVLALFYCVDKIFAHFIGGRLWVSMLAHYYLTQFGCSRISAVDVIRNFLDMLTFIPICHVILLLLLLLASIFPRILVEISLLCFAFYSQIMTEFALFALLTVALLEEHA